MSGPFQRVILTDANGLDYVAGGGGAGGTTPSGPAGTPNAAVVTVQGITGGSPLTIAGTVASTLTGQSVGITGSVAATLTGQSVGLIGTLPAFAVTPTVNIGTMPASAAGATATSAAPTYTNAQTNAPLSVDLAGNLRTIVSGGTATPTGAAGTPNAAVISVQGITGGTQFLGGNALGSIVDGASVTLGAKADAAWAGGANPGSQIAILKLIATAAADTTTPSPVNATPVSAGNMVTAITNVGTTATSLGAARPTRQGMTVVNETTNSYRVGTTGVTMANGVLLAGLVGASITVPFTGPIFAIGTVAGNVSTMDLY